MYIESEQEFGKTESLICSKFLNKRFTTKTFQKQNSYSDRRMITIFCLLCTINFVIWWFFVLKNGLGYLPVHRRLLYVTSIRIRKPRSRMLLPFLPWGQRKLHPRWLDLARLQLTRTWKFHPKWTIKKQLQRKVLMQSFLKSSRLKR